MLQDQQKFKAWCGYNNSLGIKNMDYIISDKNLIKDVEKFYKEKIIFLPKIWNAMSKPENLPEVVIYLIKVII